MRLRVPRRIQGPKTLMAMAKNHATRRTIRIY
jgi:hypothetical protein